MARQPLGLIMSETAYGRIAEVLRPHDIIVEQGLPNGEYLILKARRGRIRIVLAAIKRGRLKLPESELRDKFVVVALGESMLRFWRYGRERRLCEEIVELLKPHAWPND